MPVGKRNKVWTSACLSSSRLTVSPAPPSKRTLSGTTIAARPCPPADGLVLWRAERKLSCNARAVEDSPWRASTCSCSPRNRRDARRTIVSLRRRLRLSRISAKRPIVACDESRERTQSLRRRFCAGASDALRDCVCHSEFSIGAKTLSCPKLPRSEVAT